MRIWKTVLMATFLGGCGGGGDDASSGDDVADVDAASPIDAEPTANRAATIAIAEVALTSPDGVEGAWAGGSITVEFTDITEGGGEVLYGDSPVGGCLVVRHDADHPANPKLDAGAVTIANAGATDGLVKDVGPCDYAGAAGYQCVSNAATGMTSSATATGLSGTVFYQYPGEAFTDRLVGSYMVAAGYDNATFDSTGGPFPIIATDTASLTVLNPAAPGGGSNPATSDDATFTVINGAGPVPGVSGADTDFLAGADGSIRITKAATDDWGAIDYTVYTRGEGFTLADASDVPHEFPAEARNVSYTCSGAGGDCGADGDSAADTIEAIIVSGRTTSADVSDTALDFLMPASETYVTFQCAYPLGSTATIPEAAVEAILSVNPTRIETRIVMAAGTVLQDGLNEGRIVVGHGVVGHTTIPQ